MDNKVQNQKRINNAILIFTDPASNPDPSVVQHSVTALTNAREWARLHNFVDDENEALWGLYRCHSSTNRPLQAIEALQALRNNLERLRGKITDLNKRAGIMNKFPRLFPALCQLLYENRRNAELLDAMEGAKGRVLADMFVRKENRVVADNAFSGPAQSLPGLMQEVGAHCLSYFVEDKQLYAVLVAKDGSMHATRIPIGRGTLQEWVTEVDPEFWAVPKGGFFGVPKGGLSGTRGTLPEKLSPLLAWLEQMATSGLIAQGDHICFCPDGVLYLVPLQYVTFLGAPLVTHVSVSRVQGALALETILQRKSRRPGRFVAVQVPIAQDIGDPKKMYNLGRVPTWLEERFSGETFIGENADVEELRSRMWNDRIVHFATHGTFPREDEKEWRDPNPYTGSGLLLAHDRRMPSGDMIRTGMRDHLLTPERVLQWDFSGSHVTLHACVSGLASEGIGGDALGLEWALMQAGAESLVATHWNVADEASADFSIHFYQKWIVEGTSRAEAWRESTVMLMNKRYRNAEPEARDWAAFSLSGDWR